MQRRTPPPRPPDRVPVVIEATTARDGHQHVYVRTAVACLSYEGRWHFPNLGEYIVRSVRPGRTDHC